MSLLDSMNAAVGGLNAQSVALANISDNIANSQTTGFKGVGTSFVDYVTQSSAVSHSPDAVVATPDYSTSVQGAITQVTDPTAMAITGNGMFAVQQPTGAATFSAQQYYTRVGDFAPNSAGYLVNSTGYALDGWPVSGGVANVNGLAPIKISTAPSAPVATTSVTMAANIPSTPATGTTSYSSSEQIYDAQGNPQQLTLNWAQVPTTAGSPISATNPAVANEWNLTVSAANSPTATTTGPMLVTFGSTATTAGTIFSIGAAGAAAVPATQAAATVPAAAAQITGSAATVGVALNFGTGAQNVTLNFGNFGSATGVTQFAGTDYQVTSQTQNGSAQSAFSSVTIQPTGNVVLNYVDGNSTTIAQVPLATFSNPDGLQQQNGQAYTSTIDSGAANVVASDSAGAGSFTIGAVEGSNVDLSAQFTQMIVAQQAYTANTKMISTVNTMMQSVLQMVQG